MNKTQYAVLGMLSIQPMSGYDIKKALDQSISNFWSENYGHIYPTLRRLREEGKIELISPGTRRKVYALTEGGREALLAWLEQPPQPQPPRNELILQLFFGDLLDDAAIRTKLLAEREHHVELQQRYASIESVLAEQPQDRSRSWRMALRYGALRSGAIVAWCDECLGQLEG